MHGLELLRNIIIPGPGLGYWHLRANIKEAPRLFLRESVDQEMTRSVGDWPLLRSVHRLY